ncbi:hypothetical protein B0H17DRAFT_1180915 [Mycena rosella]|uniref:Uncharacterized protein n=1 Tax=Mycena rosella TaxID=1033263 RepID=A0AAD7DBB5_MYCRO|nr:hypothetical protein B0H17DRAFT_1180915 [Mycena rosella]
MDSGWSAMEQQDMLASFLIRHPGLENLRIPTSFYAPGQSSPSDRIPLLRLQQLECPSKILPSIVAPRMKRVKLYWDACDDDLDVGEIENTFVALKAMIPSDVPFICSNDGCNENLSTVVDSLSRNLPHTRTLQLYLYNCPLWDWVVGHLKDCLPRFMGLTFLSLHGSWVELSIQEEEEGINVLSDACPTLEACRLHQRAWRKVEGMWETYPLTDFDALAGLESWTL